MIIMTERAYPRVKKRDELVIPTGFMGVKLRKHVLLRMISHYIFSDILRHFNLNLNLYQFL